MLQYTASIAEIGLDVSSVMNSLLGLKGIISLNFCCILLKRRLVYSIQKIALESPNICVRARVGAILFLSRSENMQTFTSWRGPPPRNRGFPANGAGKWN